MTIKQFDVVPNPAKFGRERAPYLICVQYYYLDFLKTRLMAPLIAGKPSQPGRLNPALIVLGKFLFLDPTDLAAVNIRLLAEPVANMGSEGRRIVEALDLVFTGV